MYNPIPASVRATIKSGRDVMMIITGGARFVPNDQEQIDDMRSLINELRSLNIPDTEQLLSDWEKHLDSISPAVTLSSALCLIADK